METLVNKSSLATANGLLPIGYCPSAVNVLLPVDYWQWATAHGLLGMDYWQWTTGNELLAMGYWQWATANGLLQINYCQWATGNGLLAMDYTAPHGATRRCPTQHVALHDAT